MMASDLTRDGGMGTFSCRAVPRARHVPSLADDVAHGFAQLPRTLPPKYFYDARGSQLFDSICDTPEYYPTRTEAQLLELRADAIIACARPDHIIELGSGTSRKTEALLAACERAGHVPVYWPFDVCESILRQSGARLGHTFPWLTVRALVGDYTAGLDHLPRPEGRCLYVFLGGTYGNFEPVAGQSLLREVAARMTHHDRLLLGTDRVKQTATLEAAYNDAQGFTAAFNRNVLEVINRELDGDFDVSAFEHRAIYNEAAARIEMYLIANRPQSVRLDALGKTFEFAAGEHVLTEISRKFTPQTLGNEVLASGLRQEADFVAADEAYSLAVLRTA